ncbi:MAG: sulfatase-like hydrolase/transferase [Bacteroidetes bacterium]|nr:sulfatase-like hydrolase/transferase [Bacteroidota bacterium]
MRVFILAMGIFFMAVSGHGMPDSGGKIVSDVHPLIYLVDYVREDGKLVVSWKFNARYNDFKTVHLNDSAGGFLASVDFPAEYYMLDASYGGTSVRLQVENLSGNRSDYYFLSLDRDAYYESLKETETVKRFGINRSGEYPWFQKAGDTTRSYLYGVNYIGLRSADPRNQTVGFDHSTFEAATPTTLADYNKYHAESLFRIMKSKGLNYTRVFLTGRNTTNPGISGPSYHNEPLYRPYMDNFVDFLKRAQQYGIYVFPTFGDGGLPKNQWYKDRLPVHLKEKLHSIRQYFPFYKETVDLKADYVQAFLQYIKDYDPELLHSLLAVELQNEYSVKGNAYPFTQITGIHTSWWGEEFDMTDTIRRQELADQATIRYQNILTTAIKEIDPELLVAEGFFTLDAVHKTLENSLGIFPGAFPDERHPPVFPVTIQSDIDFVDIHMYPRTADRTIEQQFNADLHSMLTDTVGFEDMRRLKPFILGEFGAWRQHEPTVEFAAGRMADLAGRAMDHNFDGWCYWTFDSFEQDRLYNFMSGSYEIMDTLAPLKSPIPLDSMLVARPDTNYMNVLLIMTDQHTFSALGAAGNAQIRTPNLDRLAQDGAFFTHCITPTPYCSPTRASIFSGLSTHNHGIWNNVDKDAGLPGLDNGVFPITEEILYEQGHLALHWGKLHVNNTNTRPKDYITGPWHCNTDFTCYESWPADISEKRDAALAELNEAAFNRGYPDWNNWQKQEHISHIPVIAQAMSSYVSDIGQSPVPAVYTREFAFGEELMEAMDIFQYRPWMFTLSYHPPHKPWSVPDPYYGMYDPDSLVLPGNQDVVFSDALASSASVAGGKEIKEKGRREFLRTYYAQITMIDDMVGEVLDQLDSLGLRERTLIVFTSDHGDMAGSHAAVGKNITAFFEPLIRVPLIVSCKGKIDGGTVVDELVTPMDLMPTLLDYAGYAELIPEGIDGSSLRPLIEGVQVSWRDHVIGMRDYATANPNTQYMIRNERWKYWWNYREGLVPHLYDLEADPLEKNNLAGNPDYNEMQMDLHNGLTDWVKDNKARQHEMMEYMEPIVGLERNSSSMPLQIYPNPASDCFSLHYTTEQAGEVAIRIFDISGRLIHTDRLHVEAPGTHEYSGSVAGLSSGTYYFRLETGTSVTSGKLIIAKGGDI